MLPATYQLPAAIVLLLGGTIACFFGYRLFRLVLAIFGFILGALAASSLFGATDTVPMLVAAVLAGLVGAALLIGAYFVGVALVGAALGAVVAHLLFTSGAADPHYLVVIFLSIVGAALAMYLQRYVLIVGTAFGGAWTLIVGAMALVGDPRALAAAAGDVWVAYPLNPAPGQEWVPWAWGALSLFGAVVQVGWTGGEHGRVRRRRR